MDTLTRNLYLVKEHVGMFKAANNFDIFDPETGNKILECREENLGLITKILRFTDYKTYTPFDVRIRTEDGRQVVRVKRGISLLRSHVEVLDENDRLLGSFHQKLLSIGGKFSIHDQDGNEVCELKGKWTGWDFKFLYGDVEMAHVSKQWAGIGKEMFTSADNYVLEISDHIAANSPARQLIIAAVMCIDMVLKE
ncbi:phospholipid scramblase-related protein [Marinomonas balearica]|uniref:Uncharacterized protein YxjI n=1 Tax=Marinomonas balearica TaxID=491947 RepID=A0A4R6MLR6_9GAMM|nr:phospholipid scramblase-related protein [Marinomonas balearica]TDP01260.1 uncharacterized protein YxjI [Marinomonas balearica]